MRFGSGTSLTYKEVTYSASVSPQATVHGSGHVSQDFLFLSQMHGFLIKLQ